MTRDEEILTTSEIDSNYFILNNYNLGISILKLILSYRKINNDDILSQLTSIPLVPSNKVLAQPNKIFVLKDNVF